MDNTSLLRTEPISKLLFNFSMPAIAGIMANALYNVVDRIFIGHAIGPQGIAAIMVAFPFMIAVMSFGTLIGVGASALISINLGEGKKENAEIFLGNAFCLAFAGGIVITAISSLSVNTILRLGGAGGALIPLAEEYITTIICGTVFAVCSFTMNYMIRAEGKPRHAMITLFIGAGTNILLDPLFIFGFSMGLKGAALATVISQALSCLWAVYFYTSKMGALHVKMDNFILKAQIVKRIVAVGISPCIMEFTFTVIMGVLNKILYDYGKELAISVMGIFFSLETFLFLPVLGIGEGVQPIIGYNYGAGDYKRVIKAIKIAIAASTAFFITSLLVIMLFPEQLISIFNTSSPELMKMAKRGMMLSYLGLPVIGLSIIATFTFQALGKAKEGMIISFSRQVLFFIPPILLLPHYWGLDGVWLSIPISDYTGALLAGFLLLREINRMNSCF